MEIAGRSFLITGGASGLGAACCRELAAADAKVMIADTDQEAGNHLAEELGTGVKFCATDVQSQEDIDAVVAASLDAHGSLNGLISCAGILRAARVVGQTGTHDLQLFRKVIDVNLNCTFSAARAAAAAIS
jgi:NAD(P)-dependent dehydrogenase (short-subunit alcohol dehydrogenase family)